MILLDTHAWVWWVSDPDRIPGPATRAIAGAFDAGQALSVSAISAWEVAMLVERGRLELTMDVGAWIALSEAASELDFTDMDAATAAHSVALENFPHRDPADRIIAATALKLDATLVTADARLRGYGPITTVWD